MSYPQDDMSRTLRTYIENGGPGGFVAGGADTSAHMTQAEKLLAYLYGPRYAEWERQKFSNLYIYALAWVKRATRDKPLPTDDRSPQPLHHVSHKQIKHCTACGSFY